MSTRYIPAALAYVYAHSQKLIAEAAMLGLSYVAVAGLLSVLLSLAMPILGARAYLAAAIDIDRWELEQSPAEIISKYGLAIKLENVEEIRGKRSGDLIIVRLEAQSLCFEDLCPTVVVRDCEIAPCAQATILARPTFTLLPSQVAIPPGTYALAFEGFGKKGIFVLVGPSFIVATTFSRLSLTLVHNVLELADELR
jgi:hypothetical protein